MFCQRISHIVGLSKSMFTVEILQICIVLMKFGQSLNNVPRKTDLMNNPFKQQLWIHLWKNFVIPHPKIPNNTIQSNLNLSLVICSLTNKGTTKSNNRSLSLFVMMPLIPILPEICNALLSEFNFIHWSGGLIHCIVVTSISWTHFSIKSMSIPAWGPLDTRKNNSE